MFTNTYRSSGSVSLKASKRLIGRNLERNQFKFILYRIVGEEDNIVRELYKTTSSAVDGSVVFGSIRFSDADDGKEFLYEIEERNDEKAGYTYDDKVVSVKLIPHDMGDGTMEFETHYYDAEGTELEETEVYFFPDRFEMGKDEYDALAQEEKDSLIAEHQAPVDPEAEETEDVAPTLLKRNAALYTNEYHAEGEIVLRAWKQMIGRELTDGAFTFELLSEELDEETGTNKVLQTKTNTSDGSIVWDAVQFDENDIGKTIRFVVREVRGTDSTVVYDTSVFGYSVKVFDNGDGTLSFRQGNSKVKKGIKGIEDGSNSVLKYSMIPIGTCDDKDTVSLSADADAVITRLAELGVISADGDATISIENLIKTSAADYLNTGEYLLLKKVETKSIDSFVGQPAIVAEFADTDAHYSADGMTLNLGTDAILQDIVGSTSEEVFTYAVDNPDKGVVGLWLTKGEDSLNIFYGELSVDYVPVYELEGKTEDIPVFTNRLQPGGLRIKKLTTWTEGDTPDENQGFTFKIKLVNPDGTPFEAGDDYEYVPIQVENIGAVPDSGDGSSNDDSIQEAGGNPASEGETNAAEGGN